MHTTGWDWILTPRGIYQGLVWKLFVLFLWFWWTDPLMSTKIWKQKKFLLVSTFGSISFSHSEIKWCWRGGDVFDTYTIMCSAVWFLLHFEFLLAKHFWWKYRKFFLFCFLSVMTALVHCGSVSSEATEANRCQLMSWGWQSSGLWHCRQTVKQKQTEELCMMEENLSQWSEG